MKKGGDNSPVVKYFASPRERTGRLLVQYPNHVIETGNAGLTVTPLWKALLR